MCDASLFCLTNSLQCSTLLQIHEIHASRLRVHRRRQMHMPIEPQNLNLNHHQLYHCCSGTHTLKQLTRTHTHAPTHPQLYPTSTPTPQPRPQHYRQKPSGVSGCYRRPMRTYRCRCSNINSNSAPFRQTATAKAVTTQIHTHTHTHHAPGKPSAKAIDRR